MIRMSVKRVESSTTIEQTVVTGVQISYSGATANIREISYKTPVEVTAMILEKPDSYGSIYTETTRDSSTTIYGTDIDNNNPGTATFKGYSSKGELRYFGWRGWHNMNSSLPDFPTNETAFNQNVTNAVNYLTGNPAMSVKDSSNKVTSINMTINHIPSGQWPYTGDCTALLLYYCRAIPKTILASGSTTNTNNVIKKVNTPIFDFSNV